MEFIPELPISREYDNVLVVKDKLAVYANFIPTSTSITKRGMVIAKFRIPRQGIMDRDISQTGSFWMEISNWTSLK